MRGFVFVTLFRLPENVFKNIHYDVCDGLAERRRKNASVIANNVHARFACPYVQIDYSIVCRLGEYASIKKKCRRSRVPPRRPFSRNHRACDLFQNVTTVRVINREDRALISSIRFPDLALTQLLILKRKTITIAKRNTVKDKTLYSTLSGTHSVTMTVIRWTGKQFFYKRITIKWR